MRMILLATLVLLLFNAPTWAADLSKLSSCQKESGSQMLQNLDHSIQAVDTLVAKTKEAASQADGLGAFKIVGSGYENSQRSAMCDQAYNLYGAAVSATDPVSKQIDQAVPAIAALKFEDYKNCLSQLKQIKAAYNTQAGIMKTSGLGTSLFPTVRAACGLRSPTAFPPAYTLSK